MAAGAILTGLLNTERWTNERYKNPRREIFRTYPNGGLALTGILSMLDPMVTNDPSYKVYEKRHKAYRTVTAQANAAGPFTDTSNVDKTAGGFTSATGTVVRIHVPDGAAKIFTVDMVIKIFNVSTTGASKDLVGRITALDTTDYNYMDITVTGATAWTNILNSTANNGLYLEGIGLASKEGSTTSSVNPFIEPVENYNVCQIFRSAFKLTGTALVTDLTYDKDGPYKEAYLDSSLKHMTLLEDALLWGERSEDTSGEDIIRYTGGLLWYLQQWELGTVYKNSSTPITDVNSDDKRIIDLDDFSDGVLTESVMDTLTERIFRTSTNRTNEKFVVCGSKFLMLLNQLYRSKSVIIQDQPAKDTYGMQITTLTSTFGKLHFYSHPRFNENPRTRGSAFFIDFDHMKYVHMKGRDIKFCPKVQLPEDDFRKDQFISESGLHVKFPETMMYLYGAETYEP